MSAETKVILCRDISDGIMYANTTYKNVRFIPYDTLTTCELKGYEIKKSNIHRTASYNSIVDDSYKKQLMEKCVLERCRINEDPEETEMSGWTIYVWAYQWEVEGIPYGPLCHYTTSSAPNKETSRLWFLIWLASQPMMNDAKVTIYPDPEQKC
jgi:hypothetical protein